VAEGSSGSIRKRCEPAAATKRSAEKATLEFWVWRNSKRTTPLVGIEEMPNETSRIDVIVDAAIGLLTTTSAAVVEMRMTLEFSTCDAFLASSSA
jgi:hypothetical protein